MSDLPERLRSGLESGRRAIGELTACKLKRLSEKSWARVLDRIEGSSGFRLPLIRLCALLAAVALTKGCGDGDSPIAPPDPPRPTTLAVSPPTAEFSALGASVQLTADVRDQNGNAVPGAAVSWTTSAAAVATVSASGLLTAVGNGTATITATAGSASGSAVVTVAQEVSAIAVTPAADTVVTGGTRRLAAEAADANGHPVAESGFHWASSDTLVAVVDDAGLVTGVGAGEAEVTATAAGATGDAVLTVVAPAPTVVTVTPDTVALPAVGQTAQLDAEVHDQIGRVMEGVRVSWSSADPTVAAVDSAGLVTAVGSGAATIAARAGEAAGHALVKVMQSAGSVVVSPPAGTVALDDTLQLAAEAFDANGHLIEDAGFVWSSSDGSVAMVDGTGLVRGVAEGAATITATSGSAAGLSEITVENPDRAALVALYEAAGGRSWAKRENWGSDRPLGEWHGVKTDDEGRVTSLELRENGLAGSIPSELGDLSALERLDLAGNGLTGPIPPELGRLSRLESLHLWVNRLTGPMPTELGNLSDLSDLVIGRNDLSGPIPPELGRLSRLGRLNLDNNRLTGPMPTELGNLANLKVLRLEQNRLTGPFPQSVLGITGLEDLRFQENVGLCVPGTTGFVAWAVAVDNRSGPFCNEADTGVLESLFESAGGPAWSNAEGWLGSPALDGWHGVRADSLGRVTALDLSRNGLVGRLPARLGELAQMTELRIAGNPDLSGRLPLSLADLSLRALSYDGTALCVPRSASFQRWLSTVESHDGAGTTACTPLSDREALEALYAVAGGSGWAHDENWLTDAPLQEWYGVEIDSSGRVVSLRLAANTLSGRIPREIGDLASLERLDLYRNGLTGPVPAELGGLANLRDLQLGWNDLSGPLPRRLLDLANLERFKFRNSGRDEPLCAPGTVPFADWLGAMEEWRGPYCNEPDTHVLESLFESAGGSGWTNARGWLDGPVLANWHGVSTDSLGRATALDLSRNGLAGRLPRNMGQLARMAELRMAGNTDLSGRLPLSLADLSLRALSYDGTALCVPRSASFQRWLSTVESHDGTGTACAQAVDSVAVSPTEATVAALGDTVRLAAEAFDASKHAVAGAEFSWESSAPSVATVDGSGLVTAVAGGAATIAATVGEASGTTEITVIDMEWAADFLGQQHVVDVVNLAMRVDPNCTADCERRLFPGHGPPDLGGLKDVTGIDMSMMNAGYLEWWGMGERVANSRVVRTYADIEAAREDGDFAIMWYLQVRPASGPWQLGGDVATLRDWYDVGLRVLQLSYGLFGPGSDASGPDERLGYGAHEGDANGVTDLGRLVIAEMNTLGMVIDCSHCSKQTTLDAAALSTKPILANHANAVALTPNLRNKSDEELMAIAATGGVIGVTPVGRFLDTDGDGVTGMDDMIAHIEYIASLVGTDHVGIASDSDVDGGWQVPGNYTGELAGFDRWLRLTARLRARGWSEEDLAKLLGGNFLRVFREVLRPQ